MRIESRGRHPIPRSLSFLNHSRRPLPCSRQRSGSKGRHQVFSPRSIARGIRLRKRRHQFELFLNNSGVVGMHMAVNCFNKVIIFDQTSRYNRTVYPPTGVLGFLLPLVLGFLLLLRVPDRFAEGGMRRSDGHWELLLNNSGVVGMHMAVNRFNKVIIFDQTSSYNRTLYPPTGTRDCSHSFACNDPRCWPHSVEYDVASNSIRPLTLRTDTWCSSGVFTPDGNLLQTGGEGDGIRGLRRFRSCSDGTCDWEESPDGLDSERWYATNQLLPDGRTIVMGGRHATSYEFVPKTLPGESSYKMPFLEKTTESWTIGWQNLYPFVYLSSDGNLFVLANQDAILFDYHRHRVVREFPRIPGGASRSYPSTASSIMLPLDHADGFRRVEVMVCGGGAPGAYQAADKKEFLVALTTCGRMVITDEHPVWAMEEMPGPRVMSDMLILPDGNVLLINGARRGLASWDFATGPTYSLYLYNPSNRAFSILQQSHIARLYHSSALVLPDGRVLVSGSNPHQYYMTTNFPYPTELRLEAFHPPYLDAALDDRRPTMLSTIPNDATGIKYGEEFNVNFHLPKEMTEVLTFHAYAPPFVSHSVSMNQRMLKLECRRISRDAATGSLVAAVVAPPSPIAAPEGYYMLTVVNGQLPSSSVFVKFTRGSS